MEAAMGKYFGSVFLPCFLCWFSAAGVAPRAAHAQPVVITGERRVAPPRLDVGDGVCVTTVHVGSPAGNRVPFDNIGDALSVLNRQAKDLTEDGRLVTVRSLINFRNNDPLAVGDFSGASLFSFSDNPGAQPPGNDRNFALRVRGYLNIDAADATLRTRTIGVYADDGARLTIGGMAILSPDVDQRLRARRMQQVRYGAAGLYPFELVYYQNGSLAVLELAESQQQIAPDANVLNLAQAGFQLLGQPQANLFVNTTLYTGRVAGAPICTECSSDAACPHGSYCATDFGPLPPQGLCQQCNDADHCGAECQACTGATPMCGPNGCVECMGDGDCGGGGAGACDVVLHRCQSLSHRYDLRYLGGCSTTAGPRASAPGVRHLLLGLCIAFLFAIAQRLRRRRSARWLIPAIAPVLIALVPAVARADLSANIMTFHPAIGPDGLVTVESTRSDKRLRPLFNVVFDYSHRPLRLVDFPTGQQLAETVPDAMTLHLMSGMGITRWLTLAADVPVVVYQSFDRHTPVADVPMTPASYGIADLRMVAKVRIINNERGGFGLAFVPQFTFPTGDATQLRSDDAYGIEPRMALDYRTRGGVIVALNAGFLGRTADQILRGMEVGSQLRYGLGTYVPLPRGFGLLGELAGGTSVSSVPGGTVYSPLETHAGVRYVHSSGLNLNLGGGAGLTEAVGSPQYRLFASIGYLPVENPPPPPSVPPPPPPPAPLPPKPLPPEPLPPEPLGDLTIDKDGDGTGVVSSEPAGVVCGQLCASTYPIEQEVRLTAVPAKDSRFAGWEGPCSGLDPCTLIVRQKTRVKAHFIHRKVVVTDTRLDLQGSVIHFETAKARIELDSFHLLDEVVLILKTRPDINLRIEGHTDSVVFYAPGGNLQLSRDRAAAVVQYLTDHGVPGSRLTSAGFGDSCPVATNLTPEGRAANRRTEFLLVAPRTGRFERTPCVAYTAAPSASPRRPAAAKQAGR
jgi:outer membrane exchange protein TraA